MSDIIKIFVSYSHADDDLLNALLDYLKGMENENVEFWTDRKIGPGEDWDEKIKANIQDCAIALVLVSQNFLTSPYCQNVEIKNFLVSRKFIFPIILSSCDWRSYSWLSSRQFLPGGKEETIRKDYTDLGKRDELFLKILTLLRERVKQIRQTPVTPLDANAAANWVNIAPVINKPSQSIETQPVLQANMADPILAARLDMLQQNLRRVASSAAWLKAKLQGLEVPDGLWEGLDATIGDQARRQRGRIREVRELMAAAEHEDDPETAKKYLRKGWGLYNEIYQQSQDIFEECLTFIGGLTFRERGLDECICMIADDLIRDCARQSTGRAWESLTVPALRETVDKTIARIIRLRFQEWTIWTLPFTAHEFGHVVISDEVELKGFIEQEIEKLLAGSDSYLRHLLENKDAEQARNCARFRLNEFLADAFATYTMGPAYACAAILLRFNPASAYDESTTQPGDARRVRIVMEMLKQMNVRAGKLSPYKEVIDYLDKKWNGALDRVGQADTLAAPDSQYLDTLVARISRFYVDVLRPTALYLPTAEEGLEEGWTVARQWASGWLKQVENKEALSIPPVTSTHKLRDVFNAAWLCRITEPDSVDRIADVARLLCESIIEGRRTVPKSRRQTKTQPTAYRK